MKKIVAPVLFVIGFGIGLAVDQLWFRPGMTKAYEQAYYLANADHCLEIVSALKRLRRQEVEHAIEGLEISLNGTIKVLDGFPESVKNGLDARVTNSVTKAKEYKANFSGQRRGP